MHLLSVMGGVLLQYHLSVPMVTLSLFLMPSHATWEVTRLSDIMRYET